MNKELCKCGKIATWCYLPNDNCYCDDCVPRGCGCNIYALNEFQLDENINLSRYIFYNQEDTILFGNGDISHKELMQRGYKTDNIKDIINNYHFYEGLDEDGRAFPCCEFMYDEDGFDKED